MGLKKRSKVSAEFSMSSLTDIIFLLLIFFMLTSTLVKIQPFELPTSDSKTVAATSVVVTIEKSGRYTLNNKEISGKAISRGLAQLTKGTGVTVNTVVPGSTLSEGAEQFLENSAQIEGKTRAQVEEAFFTEVRTSSLLQRFAKVEEVANTITYLASPLSSATNGAAIKVDGGSMGGIL